MNIKTWQAEWGENTIVVSNGWSWSGDTEERIEINGEVVLSRSYNFTEVSSDRAMGTIFYLNYGLDSVKVKVGSAWHTFGVACRIEVNGKFIGGDKIVLFAKEPAVKN